MKSCFINYILLKVHVSRGIKINLHISYDYNVALYKNVK